MVKNMGKSTEHVEKSGSKTYRLNVTDMSCAGCVETVEKTLRSMPGVSKAEVNFAERTATVTGDVSPEVLVEAVGGAGYSASLMEDEESEAKKENAEFEHYRKLLKQTIVSGVIGLIIFAVGMLNLLPDILTLPGQISWGVASLLTLFVLAYGGAISGDLPLLLQFQNEVRGFSCFLQE